MPDHDELSGEKILESIRADSAQRRSAPLEGFREFLRAIWMDNTEEEALRQWQVKVDQFPWWADDALFSLDWVIANPPKNLVDLMQEHGWLLLHHEPDSSGDEREYSREEYLGWLKEMTERFRRIYEKAAS